MFWCSLVRANRPPKEAMLVARQENLDFGVLCWERRLIRAEKIVDGRVPLPARSGYISENRATVLEKSRRGRVYPAVFRTRQGESGRRPISCVRSTLQISRYPAVSCFDQGIPCCDVYPFIFLRVTPACVWCYDASAFTEHENHQTSNLNMKYSGEHNKRQCLDYRGAFAANRQPPQARGGKLPDANCFITRPKPLKNLPPPYKLRFRTGCCEPPTQYTVSDSCFFPRFFPVGTYAKVGIFGDR